MKKLILAVALFAAMGAATAATTIPAGDSRGVTFNPFPASIFVRGINADWSATNEMSFDSNSGVYTAFVTLSADGSDDFKIASDDWSTVDLGGGTFDLQAAMSATDGMFEDPPDNGGPNANLIGFAGVTYMLSLDISNWDGSTPPLGPFDLTISQVPLPGAALLLMSALGGLGFMRRR